MELLSVVIPVYNSEETLDALVNGIHSTLNGRYPYELILIDDGSRDGSWKKLEALKKNSGAPITAIRLRKNFGQHNAIACGLGFAKGDLIVTMDDDLQHPPSEIPKLVARYDETAADVVYGEYIDKRHSWMRNTGSRFVKDSSRLMQGNSGHGSSFRLFNKEIAEKILHHQHRGFFFIDEIIHWYTGNIVTTPVEHHPRTAGRSGYTTAKLVGLYFNVLVNYTAIPLRWMTWVGLFSSIVSFAFGLRFLIMKLHHPNYVLPGFTATIVAILFSTSLLMFCMGIMGQYMYKLYQLQHRRPPYSVEKVLH